jgi:hypothetical protein
MGAGHHIYADKSEVFNETVNEVCQLTDDAGDADDDVNSPPSIGDVVTRPVGRRVEVTNANQEIDLPSEVSEEDVITQRGKQS